MAVLRRATRPSLSHKAFNDQLVRHDIQARSARTAALVALAAELPPRVLAELLDGHIHTALKWAHHAQRDAGPWTQAAFVEKVVARQRQRQMQSASSDMNSQTYDRSPICTHALSTYLGRPAPETLSAEIDRITGERVYEQQVFFIRNIGFCQPNAARRISSQELLAFERIHERSYRKFGYELVDVPAGEVINRAAMIADTISQLT